MTFGLWQSWLMTVINSFSGQERGCLVLRLLHVEASSDSITALLVQLHRSLFLMWQLKGSWVQIPKAGGMETGTMRCPVQWCACSWHRSANTQHFTAIHIIQFTGYSIKSTQCTNQTCPSSHLTKYTHVLEQKQSHRWVCLCPRQE